MPLIYRGVVTLVNMSRFGNYLQNLRSGAVAHIGSEQTAYFLLSFFPVGLRRQKNGWGKNEALKAGLLLSVLSLLAALVLRFAGVFIFYFLPFVLFLEVPGR
jgi:hypothetical protein